MIKIFLTVRNRLSITAKCIAALKRHSALPHQIYVYENLSSYKEEEHFMFFCKLYKKKLISKVVFNTKESTFNAFSKAVACNEFGYLHEIDPKKDSYDYLVFLDNDIIVTPGWDEVLKRAWADVSKYALQNVKVIGQAPGGIKHAQKITQKIAGYDAIIGTNGGSALWSVKHNFFSDIGFLDIKKFVGYDKRHDQEYWRLLTSATRGKPYILGLRTKLGIHCGKEAGSICNILTRNKLKIYKDEMIKFEDAEERIEKMTFEEFYDTIKDDPSMNDW